jgi:peptidoglycan/xylan/chitin deacetylase (PgdA/CDA1 family)
MMHRVSPEPLRDWCGNPGLYVTTTQLTLAIDTLRGEGFEIVSLDEASRRLQERASGRFACLTFDDGYRDNLDLLLPILREREACATVYVTSGFIDGTTALWWHVVEAVLQLHSPFALVLGGTEHDWRSDTPQLRQVAYRESCALLRGASQADRERCLDGIAQRYRVDPKQLTADQMMNWDMLRQLAESGLVDIGAHTVNHPVLSGLPREVVRRELADSRSRIQEMIGRPVVHFAYPYGTAETVDGTAMEVARELAFTSAALAYGGPLTDRFRSDRLPRIALGLFDDMTDLRIRLSGAGPALRRLRYDRR